MTYLNGKLLLAMPNIGDPRFARSVILLCAHSDDYAMGLVLNKPIDDLVLPDLLTQLGIEQTIKLPETKVLNGGPVATDRGFVVHSVDYHSDGATLEVCDTLSMTATNDILKSIASGGAPHLSAMTLGYAGWGAGQLEYEISENAWIVVEPDAEIVFGLEHATKWDRALESVGVHSGQLLSEGGSA